MKKIFQITCAIIITFLGASISNAASFSDVYENHVNSDSIEYVKNNGIVSGYPDGTYKPDKTINRAEFTKIIVGARYDAYVIDNCIADNIDSNQAYVHFPDVSKDAWYAKYICVARTHNIVQGYPNGFFGPSSYINFAEAAKIIVNTFGYSVSSDSVWYKPFVEKLGEKKSIPTTITDFNKKITRGEMAEMVYRLKANILSKSSATYNSIAGIIETQNIAQPEDDNITTPEEDIVCDGTNKSGGDGSYNVCIGNTIAHQLSGLTAKLLTVDASRIELLISGLPGNDLTLSVYINGSTFIGGNNGYSVAYKYDDNISSSGASISISSSSTSTAPTVDATPTPAPESKLTSVIYSNVPKKFLTIMAVNSAAEGRYEDNVWERTLKYGENDEVQVLEVAIWDNWVTGNPKKVSVYNFDSSFDPFNTAYLQGGPAWVAHRESFNILNIDVPERSSKNYLEAFKRIFKFIVESYPAEHYGVKYIGHQSGGGDSPIFGYAIWETEAELLFAYMNSIIGKKIDFLDWSTNCSTGTYNVAASQYPYTDYIISSDWPRGGFKADWANDYYRLKPEGILDSFFSPNKTIRQSLIDMVDSERLFWETDIVRDDMIAQQNKESLVIYDTSKFEDLANSTNLDQLIESKDVLGYIRQNYPEHEQKFYDFRFHYINNKDFFPWDEDTNGFRKIR